VYTALLAIASEVGLPVVNASQRRLMSKAGLASRQTVQPALKGLIVRGLIEPGRMAYKPVLPEDSPARHHWTGRWRLLPSESAACIEPSAATTLGERRAAHDAFFDRSGLGKNAHRVWDMLHGSPGATKKSLALSLGLDTRTVAKHLQALQECGLAEADAAHWFPVSRDLDAVAADLGTYGRMVRLDEAHTRERDNYDKFQSLRASDS
jgi:predicted transcriptional regulator